MTVILPDDWKDDLEIALTVAEGPTHIKRP